MIPRYRTLQLHHSHTPHTIINSSFDFTLFPRVRSIKLVQSWRWLSKPIRIARRFGWRPSNWRVKIMKIREPGQPQIRYLGAIFNRVSKVFRECLHFPLLACDWSKNVAPSFQPIRSRAETNQNLDTCFLLFHWLLWCFSFLLFGCRYYFMQVSRNSLEMSFILSDSRERC